MTEGQESDDKSMTWGKPYCLACKTPKHELFKELFFGDYNRQLYCKKCISDKRKLSRQIKKDSKKLAQFMLGKLNGLVSQVESLKEDLNRFLADLQSKPKKKKKEE